MHELKNSDYKMLTQLMSLSQKTLKKVLEAYIKEKYSTHIITEDYIIAEGDIPIALVAHMDTVHQKPPRDFYYDTKKAVLWSPDGLGADDRAGIFAIVKIIQSGLRPHVIFTTDEEVGAMGASALVSNFQAPFANMKYIIELDRNGEKDCVFYDCDNEEFEQFIESFGFETSWGTFSDISVICPQWGVAGVNLSIGYKNEHSFKEFLNTNHMLSTIEKVKYMLSHADESENHIYIPAKWTYPTESDALCCWDPAYGVDQETWKKWCSPRSIRCDKCQIEIPEYEGIPVLMENSTELHYCPDCIMDSSIHWCSACGEAYLLNDADKSAFCYKCKKNIV